MISSSRPDGPGPRGAKRTVIAVALAVGVLVAGFGVVEVLRRMQDGAAPGGAVPADDDASALVLGLADRRVADAAGRFAITVPAAWAERAGERAAPNDLILRGPRGIEVWVRLTDVGHARFDRLSDEIRRIEANYGINQNIRIVTWKGVPAVERRMRLFEKEAIALDFLVGTTNHHVQLAAKRELLAGLEPLLRQVLDTYAPAGGLPPP
ncbi:MAG: hypothetical protein FJ221_17880 [Lentisphaerae bacterium]|nr:hypothetical protein [Lentisphaerota bacterium]